MLKLLGASTAAILGATGCVRKPPREVVSRETAPEFAPPGIALHYASTWTEGNLPLWLLVRTQGGRRTRSKVNPDHPVIIKARERGHASEPARLYSPARLRASTGAASWQAADARTRASADGAAALC